MCQQRVFFCACPSPFNSHPYKKPIFHFHNASSGGKEKKVMDLNQVARLRRESLLARETRRLVERERERLRGKENVERRRERKERKKKKKKVKKRERRKEESKTHVSLRARL